MAIEDTIFISGGSESSPFWIAKGPGFLSDQLFPTDTTLYDFVPTALAHFGFENTELPGVIRSSKIAKSTRRGRPIPVEKFPPIDEIISSISTYP
jgi:hypothetical protein